MQSAACDVTTPDVGANATLVTGLEELVTTVELGMDSVVSVICDAGFEFALGRSTQHVMCGLQGWNLFPNGDSGMDLQPCREGEAMPLKMCLTGED